MLRSESTNKKQRLSLTEHEKLSQQQKRDQLKKSLRKAEKYFQKANVCAWGLGLTFYTKAIYKFWLVEQIALNNFDSVSTAQESQATD